MSMQAQSSTLIGHSRRKIRRFLWTQRVNALKGEIRELCRSPSRNARLGCSVQN